MATATTEKVTFVLPAELVRQIRETVQRGEFPSQNAFAREALKRELKRIREEAFEREMQEAAQDPLFMQDLQECMHDFRFVDAETARMLPPYEEDDE